MSSSIDKSDKTALNNTREVLICNYSNSIVSEKKSDIEDNEKNIKKFKNDILKEIASIIGDINQNQVSLDSVIKDKLDISEDYRKKLKENASKHLAGTQLKKDIYEENTRHTISLVYYILGMGFMGYYIFKLLKK
jgi:spore coat polysaccharide biosynthesis predicted glycosyltransferase SpsG